MATAATDSDEALRQRIAELEGIVAMTSTTLARVTDERDRLRRAYSLLREQYELLRRQIFFRGRAGLRRTPAAAAGAEGELHVALADCE